MDKKKVVDELNTDVLPFLQHHCDIQCDREKRWISKMIITVHNVLALLKEQDAVTVHDPGAFCPKCEWMLYPEDHQKFCGNCGYPVKWE